MVTNAEYCKGWGLQVLGSLTCFLCSSNGGWVGFVDEGVARTEVCLHLISHLAEKQKVLQICVYTLQNELRAHLGIEPTYKST